jgi:hypothetical protein
MAILKDIVDALTPKETKAQATVETKVTKVVDTSNSDIAWETAITGETEAVIHSED